MNANGLNVQIKRQKLQDFPGDLVVKTLSSTAGGVGSIPDQWAKIPYGKGKHKRKKENIKQKEYCNKFNKDFKNSPQKQKHKIDAIL